MQTQLTDQTTILDPVPDIDRHNPFWRSGYRANDHGIARESCTLPLGSDRAIWQRGWDRAQEDREILNHLKERSN